MHEYLIYGLVDPETGHLRYVGKSSNGIGRARAAHGRHCERWRSLVRSKGLEPASIVIEHLGFEEQEKIPKQELDAHEVFWIAYFKRMGCPLTNMTAGGDGAYECTAETRAKRSASLKGRVFSEEHKKRIRESWHEHHPQTIWDSVAERKRGKPRDAETRKKLSQALKGKPWSDARRAASKKG